MSDTDIENAMELQKQGTTGEQIAQEFSVSRSTLLKSIREYKALKCA